MKCGLGNWHDISEQFVKGSQERAKSPTACETHYYSVLMKQAETIEYKSALEARASLPGGDHAINEAQVERIREMVSDYIEMKKAEKRAEE